MKQQFIYITAGNGGQDAHEWARMLLHMMIRHAERSGAGVMHLELERAEGLLIKSAMMRVFGEVSFESEIGVHRLHRISPFDAEARRCTSFAAVTSSESQKPDWGTSIRSYLPDSDSIVDHRTNKKTAYVSRVLDGELGFIGVMQ